MKRVEVSPAALGSIGLHVAVALALMISWGTRDLKVGSVVPVTIVASAPPGEPPPAVQAATAEAAATEAPVPKAPPEPAPPPPKPAPAPTPEPPKPVVKAPAPTPAPAPAKPQAKPEKSLDLDALAASLTKPARNAPQKPSSAAQGPSRPETAPVARDTAGTSPAAQAALQGLVDNLQRRWNPNCNVEGGRDVVVRVVIPLGMGGQVAGDVPSQIKSARTPAATVGAERAVRAVYAAAPFKDLPHELYGQKIGVTFDASKACAQQ